jgi:hypothetical protein
MPFMELLECVNVLTEMKKNIRPFSDFYKEGRLSGLIHVPGIYAFWWKNNSDEDRNLLSSLNREVFIKGKREKQLTKEIPPVHQIHKVSWNWNLEQDYVCLYVGKSSNIATRIQLHLGSRHNHDWYLKSGVGIYKEKRATKHNDGFLLKWDTACQFRAGMEHLLKTEVVKLRFEDVLQSRIYFSHFTDFGDDSHKAMTERFYAEDLAIGVLRPWFNVDSER